MGLYSFVVASIIIILLPGTGVIYTISTGISRGKKASIIAALGCTLGIVPHLCVSITLLVLLLGVNTMIFQIVKIAGALYLLYLGIGMIIYHSEMDLHEDVNRETPVRMIRRGILINLLNPKLTMFFFSFLPQYLTGQDCYVRKSAFLGLTFMFLTFIVFCGYGLLAGSIRDIVLKSEKGKKRLQQSFGVIFILFSIQMLMN